MTFDFKIKFVNQEKEVKISYISSQANGYPDNTFISTNWSDPDKDIFEK